MNGAEKEEVRGFYEYVVAIGSKIAGNATGLGVAVLTSNPVLGIITAPFISAKMEKIGKEILARQLGPRQESRIGATILLAAIVFNERIQLGHQLRSDDFLWREASERPPVDEIIEGVLFSASQAYEEKKLPYISNLMANSCFNDGLDLATVNLINTTLNRISYRGFTLIKIASQIDKYQLGERPRHGGEPWSAIAEALGAEMFGMANLGLFEFKESEQSDSAFAILGIGDIQPSMFRLSRLGKLILENCGLARIPLDDATYLGCVGLLRKISIAPIETQPTVDGGNF
jgi:hypothetical protein